MAGGLLGKAVSVSNVNTKVAQINSNVNYVLASLNLVNTGTKDTVINIAISSSQSVNPVDYVDYKLVLSANNSLVRSCLLMNAGESVYINCDSNNVVARLYGIEQNGVGVTAPPPVAGP